MVHTQCIKVGNSKHKKFTKQKKKTKIQIRIMQNLDLEKQEEQGSNNKKYSFLLTKIILIIMALKILL